ncbi:GTPase [Streptomyces sp. LaBMicrA B280]|uniref:YfjP family GTPase n=1 Tax=Streptomyces sp. LaBMicrA B280 TaxID=3391001 RepID=UPI003BA5F0C6
MPDAGGVVEVEARQGGEDGEKAALGARAEASGPGAPESEPGGSPRAARAPRTSGPGSASAAPADSPDPSGGPAPAGSWDDGLIARRITDASAAAALAAPVEPVPARGGAARTVVPLAYEGPLRSRLDALRELVGLSRTRLDGQTLAEAGRVLDEAAERRKLSGRHTVVAIAGATGSGKSQLFNSLAGVAISETGVRRPTTSSPIACSWSDGAAGLIDRLGIPGRLRRRPLNNPESEEQLRGLVLIDLPDHDSAAVQHREQVDRILKLVDAVIWVVDPEKYADAVLHERYLRPMAGHAEVMFVVLNQVDRLPGEAADQVLDDLRRLLDEDGVALGEHGEPGATVLALSALTGEGVGELRESLGEFVAERGAAARRVAADVDAAAAGLRPVYAAGRRAGAGTATRPGRSGSRCGRTAGPSARSGTRHGRRSGKPPRRARPPNGPGCATPTGPAARPGCGCGAGTRSAVRRRPAAIRRAPSPTRRRRRGSAWNRRSVRWPTGPRPGCRCPGRRRCARRPYAVRRGCRRRWTNWRSGPGAPPGGRRVLAGGRRRCWSRRR